MPPESRLTLTSLADTIVTCRKCPRLVTWREQVACEKRAAYRDETYWGRPVPGFGDPQARILVLGLAPAAHGANRTGRMFTGDRSGDWLYAALFRAGLTNRPESVARDDGLVLNGIWITAPVRCAPPANKPSPDERDSCLPFLESEINLLPRLRVTVALGNFAWDVALKMFGPVRPKPRFRHGATTEVAVDMHIVGCYHPSQQNTFTGRLTTGMMDDVLATAKSLAGIGGAGMATNTIRGSNISD